MLVELYKERKKLGFPRAIVYKTNAFERSVVNLRKSMTIYLQKYNESRRKNEQYSIVCGKYHDLINTVI